MRSEEFWYALHYNTFINGVGTLVPFNGTEVPAPFQ